MPKRVLPGALTGALTGMLTGVLTGVLPGALTGVLTGRQATYAACAFAFQTALSAAVMPHLRIIT